MLSQRQRDCPGRKHSVDINYTLHYTAFSRVVVVDFIAPRTHPANWFLDFKAKCFTFYPTSAVQMDAATLVDELRTTPKQLFLCSGSSQSNFQSALEHIAATLCMLQSTLATFCQFRSNSEQLLAALEHFFICSGATFICSGVTLITSRALNKSTIYVISLQGQQK